MLTFFKKATAPLTGLYLAETATLDTKHGTVRMNRMQLSSGDTAYICHMATKPEAARLHAGRVAFEPTDRSTNREYDNNCDQIISEETPPCGKSGYIEVAEQACNRRLTMNNALVVVFFDPYPNARNGSANDKGLSADDIIGEIRARFPAIHPELDTRDKQEPAPTKAVEPQTSQPAPGNFHYSC